MLNVVLNGFKVSSQERRAVSTDVAVYKQPSEVFYKNNFASKFHNIHRKTLVFESLLNKVAGHRPVTL